MVPLKTASVLLVLVLFSPWSLANTALVIIDMQPFFSKTPTAEDPENQAKINDVLDRQRELIQLAKRYDLPILRIEYKGLGHTHRVLVQQIGDYENTVTIQKNTDGMFADNDAAKEITEYLVSKKVTQLIVSGANGGFCVKCSIEGALQNRYHVWVDAHSVIDFNYGSFVHPYRYTEGQLSRVSRHQENFHQFENEEDVERFIAAQGAPQTSLGCRSFFDWQRASRGAP